MVGSILQTREASAEIERNGEFHALHAPRRVAHEVWHWDTARNASNGPIHHPDFGTGVGHGRGCLAHHAREHRRLLNHEKHRKGNADEQRCELALVVDEQFVGDVQNASHERPALVPGGLLVFARQ